MESVKSDDSINNLKNNRIHRNPKISNSTITFKDEITFGIVKEM